MSTERRDFIENFVPFIATLIRRKNYRSVNVNVICKDFESEYGLSIPYHPMLTILTRTMRNGYLERKRNGEYIPVKDKIIVGDFTDIAAEQERKHKKVIK